MCNLLFPPTRARHQFFVSMARLVKSGVSLEDALTTVETTGRGRLNRMATMGLTGLRRGLMFYESLDNGDGLFTRVQLGILEAGEKTGHLESNLKHLAEMAQETISHSRKLLSSLAYPLVVLVFSCFLTPLPTIVTGSARDYLLQALSQLLVLCGAGCTLYVAYRAVMAAMGHAGRGMPGAVERLVFPSRRAYFFLVLKTSMQSGLPIREALLLAGRTWSAGENKRLTEEAVQQLDHGENLTKALAAFVDPSHVVILASGEQSGKLEESFAELHETYSVRSATRRKLILIIVSILASIALMAYVASGILSTYQDTVQAPMQELEQMMNREMKGIWQGL